MNDKPTQEEREGNQAVLIASLQNYFRILKADFDAIMEEHGGFDETDESVEHEDANWLYSEMARTGTFIRGLSEDAFDELGNGRVAFLNSEDGLTWCSGTCYRNDRDSH